MYTQSRSVSQKELHSDSTPLQPSNDLVRQFLQINRKKIEFCPALMTAVDVTRQRSVQL